jgi:predicted nucleic acid-binding protein
MSSYGIDTNVLLRAVARTSAQHDAAVQAITALIEQDQQLYLAPQVLMEFWSVATRPVDVNGFEWSVDFVCEEIDKLLDQFPLLPETPAVFQEWLRLVTQQKVIGKQVHDARLVALLKTHQITHLLTFNGGDFKGYSITVVSPDELLAH